MFLPSLQSILLLCNLSLYFLLRKRKRERKHETNLMSNFLKKSRIFVAVCFVGVYKYEMNISTIHIPVFIRSETLLLHKYKFVLR